MLINSAHNSDKYALQTLLHHWITEFAPPQYLAFDRGTEYGNKDMAHLFNINHSPRTAYSPWTNGVVEVQNHNHYTHLRRFFTKPSC